MSTKVGIIAEQKFQLLCLERDIPIFSPILDHYNIDFIIKKGGKFVSIQVKSTLKKDPQRNAYKIGVTCGYNSRKYSANAFDFVVVYLFDISTFYIIPFKVVTGKTIRINPDSVRGKYNKYKEAWHLLN